MPVQWIFPTDPPHSFPPVERALPNPEGLLAVGGDLSTTRLLAAYRRGIFPWYEVGQPILWWSPDPRAVLHPERLRISRSLRKTLRNRPWTVRFDTAFRATITACAAPRRRGTGTWITPEMLEAYCRLHSEGHAHSIEVYDPDEQLIGGLYGVSVGRVFYGESMFSRRSDASKVALAHLSRHLYAWGFPLIDCQMESDHILRMGAEMMPRRRFVETIEREAQEAGRPGRWEADPALDVLDWPPPQP